MRHFKTALFVFGFVAGWLFFGPVALLILCAGLLNQGESKPLSETSGYIWLMGIASVLLAGLVFLILSLSELLWNATEHMFSLRI